MATINTQKVKLNNGTEIPIVGLGTWQSSPEDAYNGVLSAIKAGYKHIDTAWIYGNEPTVGKAIADSGVPREELFITTKLWNTDHPRAELLLERSLKNLGLEYLDLYLIHWPVPFNPEGNDDKSPTKVGADGEKVVDILDVDYAEDLIKTWKSLEKIYKETNKLKAIGVSNVPALMLEKLLAVLEIKPVVNQVENHPQLPQPELYEFCSKNDIVIEAYSPLGSTGAPVLKNEKIQALAEKYDVSPATIAISWQVLRGVVVLPKSVTELRIISNLKTVTLADEDVKLISELYNEVGEFRVCDPAGFWKTDLFGTQK